MINQEIFFEISNHLINDNKPSLYFNQVSKSELFTKYPLTLLNKMKKTEQSEKHHPEGNVWNHTMLVVDEAAIIKEKSRDSMAFMWAALLHDIGKPDTTRVYKGRIVSYDHDKAGAKIARRFLSEFTNDEFFIDKVSALVRWHMQVLFVDKNLPFADFETMKKQTDIFEIALLGVCDRMGRKNVDRESEKQNILMFLEKCAAKDTDKYIIKK